MIFEYWQDIAVGVAVLAALAYYVRRRLRARGAACEGCASDACATGAETPPGTVGRPDLIAVEELSRPDPQR